MSRAIFVGTFSASALSEIVDAGDIIVAAGNHENQTIKADTAFALLSLCDAPIAQDVLHKKRDCAIIGTPRDTLK